MNSSYYSTWHGNNTNQTSYDGPNLLSQLTPRAADNNHPSSDPFHDFGRRKSTMEEFQHITKEIFYDFNELRKNK